MQIVWDRAKETIMTKIELENRVWLLANHEEKNELLELGKVYAHV